MALAYYLACPSVPSFFICFICLFVCLAHAQEPSPRVVSGRSPHGLAYQDPMLLSPAAFQFFHPALSPSTTIGSAADADSPGYAPPPVGSAGTAGAARASTVREKVWPAALGGGSGRAKAGGVAAVMLGTVLAVFLASGLYCVLSRQRANAHKANATLLAV